MYKKKRLTETHRRNIGLAIKGKIRSEETRKRMSEGGSGRVFSDEHRKNISLSKKGTPSPRKGTKVSEESKIRMSIAAKKRYEDHPELRKQVGDFHRGMRHSEETKAQLSASLKQRYEDHPEEKQKQIEHLTILREMFRGQPRTEEHCKHLSESLTGRKRSDEACKNISKGHKGVPRPDIAARETGSKSHFWKGGISFAPYCEKFNREFKERVRSFFNHTCVLCGTPQIKRKHGVHHVNYDKETCCNDGKPLFICLCVPCHTKTNFNREYWQQHFTDMINNYYGGKCYFTKEEMISFLKKSL